MISKIKYHLYQTYRFITLQSNRRKQHNQELIYFDISAIDKEFNLRSNGVWEIYDTSITYEFVEDHGLKYSTIKYHFHMKRRSQFFVVNLLVPSVTINYLSVLSFCITCHTGEKIAYAVSIFLAQTVNFMVIPQIVPNGGLEVPILGQYLLASILYIGVALTLTVKIEGLYQSTTPEVNMKSRLYQLIYRKLGPHFCVTRNAMKDIKEREEQLRSLSQKENDTGNKKHISKVMAFTEDEETKTEKEDLLREIARLKLQVVCEAVNNVSIYLSFWVVTIMTVIYVIILVAN